MYQFGYYLIRNASMNPNQLAFSCYGKEYTWKELNMEANRVANSLKALGVRKGDRVGYMFRNCAETVLTFLATQKIGATAMPVNTHFLSEEIARIMKVTDCKAMLFAPDFTETIHKAASLYGGIDLFVTLGEPVVEGDHSFSELYGGSIQEAQADLEERDESIIIFTSGTTGTSKAVVRSQKNMREYGQMLAIENDNSHHTEVALTHCPFFHTACLSILVKMMALCGTFVMVNKVDSGYIFDQIEKYQVTQMLAVPPLIYLRLYDSHLWQGRSLECLREAQFTGGKCSQDYIMKICEMFPNAKLRASYGSTETCAPCSMVVSKEELLAYPERITSVGHINANCELKIVDSSMKEVAVGEVGEAVVRSPMLFGGYLKNDALNRRVFTDGWFHTEDLMRVDENGYYYLVDRIKDMIKSGGENVYAQEVEDVLRSHPAIVDCAVIGVPDPKFEEAVAAAIVLEKGAALSDKELLAYCRNMLPSYKKPRYVAFMTEIPHNVTGKVQKSILRQHPEQFRLIQGLS